MPRRGKTRRRVKTLSRHCLSADRPAWLATCVTAGAPPQRGPQTLSGLSPARWKMARACTRGHAASSNCKYARSTETDGSLSPGRGTTVLGVLRLR